MTRPDYTITNTHQFNLYAQNVLTNMMETYNLLERLDLRVETDDLFATVKTVEYGKHHCFVKAYVPRLGWMIYETMRTASPRDHVLHGGVTHLVKPKSLRK